MMVPLPIFTILFMYVCVWGRLDLKVLKGLWSSLVAKCPRDGRSTTYHLG